MRALEYRFSPARWLAARHAGARLPALAVACAGLRLREVPATPLPGPDWVPVRVRLAGICGTDVSMLRGHTGPQLSPFVSFPSVPGHEVLGIAEAGPLAGQRVVCDPMLACTARGLPPCPACARGDTALCARFAGGSLAPGIMLGFCRDLPGGWAERIVVHGAALHAVPAAVSDEAAVLAEPLAVALHAVLRIRPAPGSRVLVIGAGTVGLCTAAALRLLAPEVYVVVVARHSLQRRRAAQFGAAQVVGDLEAAGQLALDRGWAAEHPGLMGARGRTGGYDIALDAVGSAASLAGALRLVRAGGTVALLGCSGLLPQLELTWLWAHELQLHGFCAYGQEPEAGGVHTIALALRLLAEHPELDLGSLLTHRFPLERYREALGAAFFHRRSGSLKVVFTPGEGA